MATASSILELIKQLFQINLYLLSISACIGAAIYKGVDSDTDSLILVQMLRCIRLNMPENLR